MAGLFTTILLVLATTAFVMVTIVDSIEVFEDVNRWMLRLSGGVIYGLALIMSFLLAVAQEYLDDPSIPDTGVGPLERAFEDMEDGNGNG